MLRRFAPGVELPLTVMTVLSPAILPSINLMLDVPALALSLASVYLFLGACDRDSFGRAALAGFVAGLAMQTKYTGAVAPAVMLLAAATTGRWRLWPAAAVAAAGLPVVGISHRPALRPVALPPVAAGLRGVALEQRRPGGRLLQLPGRSGAVPGRAGHGGAGRATTLAGGGGRADPGRLRPDRAV